jgi:uncharacterized paraquat-inducible protein A
MKSNALNAVADGWLKHALGPLLILVAVSFPFVLFLPLLSTRIPLISHNEIVLAFLAYDLFYADKFLFVVVFVFGMVVPVCKMLCAVLCWYRFDRAVAQRCLPALSLLSKLSMLDVMLLAVFIVAFKGLGVGVVSIRYGLYAYVVLVLCSLFLTLLMESEADRRSIVDSKVHL